MSPLIVTPIHCLMQCGHDGACFREVTCLMLPGNSTAVALTLQNVNQKAVHMNVIMW